MTRKHTQRGRVLGLVLVVICSEPSLALVARPQPDAGEAVALRALADDIAGWLSVQDGNGVFRGERRWYRVVDDGRPFEQVYRLGDPALAVVAGPVQATAACQSARYLAVYARSFPDRAAQVPLAAFGAKLLRFRNPSAQGVIAGGFGSIEGSTVYSSFSTAICGLAMLEIGRTLHDQRSIRYAEEAASSLRRVQTLDPDAGSPGAIADRIDRAGRRSPATSLINVAAASLFSRLARMRSGRSDSSPDYAGWARETTAFYRPAAERGYAFFALAKPATEALPSVGRTMAASKGRETCGDDAFHRKGSGSSCSDLAGTFGSDGIAYALLAFADAGADDAELARFYEAYRDLPTRTHASTTAAARRGAIDPAIGWSGLFYADRNGRLSQEKSYYDTVKLGMLLPIKRRIAPADWRAGIKAMAASRAAMFAAILDPDMRPISSNSVHDAADEPGEGGSRPGFTLGSVAIAGLGLGILDTLTE